MSFHIFECGADDDKVIVLEETESGTKAEIYAFGALLNVFSVKQNDAEKNVIFGFENTADARKNITPLFQSAKLSPFACRMKEGHYTFANHKYKIEKYYNQREAIHGLIYDALFTVKESGITDDSAFVMLTYDFDKADPGYPFFYRINITYRLAANNRLTITTALTNLNASPIPVADGWHPYFSFGKKVNALQLRLHTKEVVEFDNRLLPTGQFLPYTDFVQPRLIEETTFDNCFVLEKNGTQPACTLTDTEDRLQVNIYPEKNYPYLQVFIPDTRTSIAIENLSSLPDSFNNAIGLHIIDPYQTHEFVTMYEIQLL